MAGDQARARGEEFGVQSAVGRWRGCVGAGRAGALGSPGGRGDVVRFTRGGSVLSGSQPRLGMARWTPGKL